MRNVPHSMPDAFLAGLAEDLKRDLLVIESLDGITTSVDTPVIYPGGKSVVVHLRAEGDRFFVSDAGMAGFEAHLMGEKSAAFSRTAHEIAEDVGAKFSESEFFFSSVRRDQLPGAIAMIADCSQRAVTKALDNLSAKHDNEIADRLFKKIKHVFCNEAVDRDAKIIGASDHKWRVTALVKMRNGRQAMFDPVSNHASSISHAVTKFYDIGRLEQSPLRFAYTRETKDFSPDNLLLLSSLCNIVNDKTPNEAIAKLVREAA